MHETQSHGSVEQTDSNDKCAYEQNCKFYTRKWYVVKHNCVTEVYLMTI